MWAYSFILTDSGIKQLPLNGTPDKVTWKTQKTENCRVNLMRH